jgi:hypothetical protein
MALKFKIAKLEDAPEAVRSLYKAEGSEFVLDAEGVVDKSKLDEFRNNNIALSQRLDKLKDIDPAKYNELMDLDRKVKEKQLIDKGDIEGLVEMRVREMKTTHETALNDLTTKLTSSNRTLETLMVDNVVRDRAIKSGVLPSAVDDVVLRAKTVYVFENNAPVPKDRDGKVMYGKDGTSPMPIDEWIGGLRKSAPHLFQGSTGTGAGGGGGTGQKDFSKMSPAAKIAHGLANLASERAGAGPANP